MMQVRPSHQDRGRQVGIAGTDFQKSGMPMQDRYSTQCTGKEAAGGAGEHSPHIGKDSSLAGEALFNPGREISPVGISRKSGMPTVIRYGRAAGSGWT